MLYFFTKKLVYLGIVCSFLSGLWLQADDALRDANEIYIHELANNVCCLPPVNFHAPDWRCRASTVQADGSEPLSMEKLTFIGRIGFSMNTPSIYKDELNHIWFVKEATDWEIAPSYMISKLLEHLHPGRFAALKLIANEPMKIASKQILNFLTLAFHRRLGCEINPFSICKKLFYGHEDIVALVEFLGFFDLHEGNLGVVDYGDAYEISAIDYDYAFRSFVSTYDDHTSCGGVEDTPLIPQQKNQLNDEETRLSIALKFHNNSAELTLAYAKIARMTDQDIETILSSAIDDLRCNGLWVDESEKNQKINLLIQSRNRIKAKLEAQQAIDYALNHDFQALNQLLAQRSIMSLFSYNGESLIEIIHRKGNDEMINLMMNALHADSMRNPNAIYCNRMGYLKQAIKNKNLKWLQELIDAQADLNLDQSILITAVESQNLELVQFLLNQPTLDVSLQSSSGEKSKSFLKSAILLNDIPMVKLLINDVRIGPNYQNETATGLETAIQKNNLEIVKILLAHPDIDPNLTYDGFQSPLNLAIRYNRLEAVKLLLQHPRIDVTSANFLAWAISNRNVEMIKLLLDHPNIIVDVNLNECKFLQQNNIKDERLSACTEVGLNQNQ